MSVQEHEQLWGGETTKAVNNFPVSGERVPVPVVRWLGRIKGSAARVNAELGLLDAEIAQRIAEAADRVAAGEFDDQFPIDVFQTGSGTSSNMTTNDLLPALERLEAAFQAKAGEFHDIVKSGRTHLMDAVPVTLGQEFSGYAAQIRLGGRRVRNALPQVAQIPLGGTATGTGLNTHREFAGRVRNLLSQSSGLEISPPEDPFEAQGNRDALVELSGAL